MSTESSSLLATGDTNSTVTKEDDDYPDKLKDELEFIVANVLGILCLIVATVIVISMIVYMAKKRRSSNRRQRRRDRMLYWCAITSGLFDVAFLSCCLLAYNYGKSARSSEFCNVIGKVVVELSIFGTSGIYIFIWIRQRIIYESPALDGLNKRLLKRCSNAAIVIMTVGLHSQAILYNALNSFLYIDKSGCGFSQDYVSWPALAVSCTNVVCQATMLFLFIYPFARKSILKHKKTKAILVRLVAATVVCMVSDGASGLYIGVYAKHTFYLPLVCYAFSSTINLCAVLLTFGYWTQILLTPFTCKAPKEEPITSQASMI